MSRQQSQSPQLNRLFQADNQPTSRLLHQLALQTLQSRDLKDFLNVATAEMRALLNADRTIVCRVESDASGRAISESNSSQEISVLGQTVLPPNLIQTYLTRCQQEPAQAIDNVSNDELSGEFRTWCDRWQVQANLAVPLWLGSPHPKEKSVGEFANPHHAKSLPPIWGFLLVQHCQTPHGWQSDEISMVEQVATQVAIGIQQIELHQQLQQLSSNLEQQVRQQTTELRQALTFEAMLKRITDKVRDSLDASQILQTAVEELALGLDASCCNAALYDLGRGTSTICYEYAASIPASQGRVAQMASSRELYAQLLQGECFQFCSVFPNPVRGRVAMLACPIVDDKGVLGDLWLVNQKNYLFSDLEIRVVQQVANQCAIAIRQAWLYQAAQTQVKELEKLNRLKDEFLSTVSHELRTPMSNIKMATQLLKFAPNPEKQRSYLGILEAECSREIDLINDLLDLQRLEMEAYPINSEALDLQDWVPELVQPFYSRTQEREQALSVDLADNLPVMTVDKSGLERILAELINNACKYTQVGGQILVNANQIMPMRQDGSLAQPAIAFIIRNTGEIPAEELPHIFEKFYRVPNADPWKQGGTGLGLALVQRLAGQLGGNIQAVSEDGWTTFTVQLPLEPETSEAAA